MLLLSQKFLTVSNILLPHMREDANATRQLHCQWRCGPADAKHAAKRFNAVITFYAF